MTLSSAARGGLCVDVDAPFFADPPPPAPPGPTERLWEYEVVELFVAGPGSDYLELEFGPHGHYLAIQLADVRTPARSVLLLAYDATRSAGARPRFQGRAIVEAGYLPAQPWTANAYAIHRAGCRPGGGRCHHAHAPVPGAVADFHRPECFVPVPPLTTVPAGTRSEG